MKVLKESLGEVFSYRSLYQSQKLNPHVVWSYSVTVGLFRTVVCHVVYYLLSHTVPQESSQKRPCSIGQRVTRQ